MRAQINGRPKSVKDFEMSGGNSRSGARGYGFRSS